MKKKQGAGEAPQHSLCVEQMGNNNSSFPDNNSFPGRLSNRYEIRSFRTEEKKQYLSVTLRDRYSDRELSLLSITPGELVRWILNKDPMATREKIERELYRMMGGRR